MYDDIKYVKWLIDDRSFPEDTNPLFEALDNHNIEYKRMEGMLSILEKEDWYSKYFESNKCVVVYGCLDVCKYTKRTISWIPGVFYDNEKYNCTNYYPVFGDNLLNANYCMLPYGELSRRKEWLYDRFGEDRAIFIRPNRGDKIFTGQLVYKENFYKDIELFGFYDIEPRELCIVAEPYNIDSEWRFVVVDGEPISSSLYKENGVVGSRFGCDCSAYEFAASMAKLYSPDRVWILDICRTKGSQYKVLEIGAFSCAGLYACDRNNIVEKVSKVAFEEWRNVFEYE
jgi:hypothetical protein